MSIPTIGEHLFRRPGCDGKEAVPHRDCSEIGDHRIDKVQFNMLKYINATNEVGWLWIAVVGERWIIWEIVKIDDHTRLENRRYSAAAKTCSVTRTTATFLTQV